MENKDWEKEEWDGWKIVSDMLDSPDALGIYPTSECYQKLYDFVVAQKEQAKKEERERILERIEEMKTEHNPTFESGQIQMKGYNPDRILDVVVAANETISETYNKALSDLKDFLQQ